MFLRGERRLLLKSKGVEEIWMDCGRLALRWMRRMLGMYVFHVSIRDGGDGKQSLQRLRCLVRDVVMGLLPT